MPKPKKPKPRTHMFMIRMNSDEHKEAVRRRDKLDTRMYLAEYARRAMLGLLPRDSEDDDGDTD